ncbi:MAG: hypothetical protein IKQ97_05655 [Eubacterium sp.]|nr:hypothetical protein [Eubacterium sp.]
MNFIVYSELWVLGCSLVGVIFAVIGLLKHYRIMYLRMVCWAVICAFFARLFHVFVIVFFKSYDFNINMGTMGVFGSLLFLLSANYGQINGLVDDGSRRAKKARLIALIAPLIIIAMYLYAFYMWGGFENVMIELYSHINLAIVAIVIMPCIYFNFKHLIIYDVEGGIVKSLRPYNALAVIYELMVMAEWITMRTAEFDLFVVTMVVQGIVLLLLVPVAGRGVKKWMI